MNAERSSRHPCRPGDHGAGCVDRAPLLCVSFDTATLRRLRRRVGELARTHLRTRRQVPQRNGAGPGALDERAEDFALAVSEITTNAVVHGGGRGRLCLWSDPDGMQCEISDTGPGLADDRAGTSPPDPSARGGYGLWLARALTRELRLRTGPAGTTVVLTL